MLFYPIASGSSGNCTYVGTKSTHILVDAGISGKKIETALSELKNPNISAIFVTHEHGDHVLGIGVMARRYNLPIYATPKTWQHLPNSVGEIPKPLRHNIIPNQTIFLQDLAITAFDIPHDAAQPVGYFIETKSQTAAVATDLGYVTDTIRNILRNAQVLLIESNHDVDMLKNGNYPAHLKERILSSTGHLSNVAAGILLVEIANPKLRHIYLGHLSEENNHPQLAFNTVSNILTINEVSLDISVAKYNDRLFRW